MRLQRLPSEIICTLYTSYWPEGAGYGGQRLLLAALAASLGQRWRRLAESCESRTPDWLAANGSAWLMNDSRVVLML